jgi:hypothetical protein
MINASSSGQQVWVAAGTYKPTTGTDRTISFAMKNGVSLYGGFAGSETALNARPVINMTTPSATILSGDIGDIGDPEDNSFHVILNRLGVTNITALDGFVITGGNANVPGPVQEPQNIGGGICNVGQSSFANPSSGPPSSPQISNCLFVANSATSGGAIYNGGTSNMSGTVLNCVFRANTATNGGAIYNVGGTSSAIQPKLTNCFFQSNSADAGGAVYNYGYFGKTSSPELTNCSFQDNNAATGGAVYNNGRSDGGNSSPALTNCSFKNNKASNQGGAIFNDGDFNGNSSPLIRNCSFQTNSANSGGGAIFNLTGRVGGSNMSRPKLTNCVFQTNTAPYGGAIFNDTVWEGEIDLVLTNCSFQANRANFGGVIGGTGYGNGYVSTTTLTNCVLFDNGGASTIYNDKTTTSTSATYSLFDASVTGYSGSTGNRTVTVSPFASTTDPALFACSPAVNAGLNSATGLAGVTTDLANNPRIFGDRVDMGAYEYQAAGGLTVTAPSVSSATTGVAFSQPFTASAGTGPYSYSLASGSLPPGLSLATNGTLSGMPSGVGSFSVTVKATNATSCSGVSAAYVLRVVSGSPIRYVRAGATGNGTSWADASGDLQSQINVAGAEQVWVAQGTYKPTTGTDRTISFSMKNGLPIYGGFAGTETSLSQRVLSIPLTTILSGDIGTSGNSADNSYHVVNNSSGLNNSAVLDGFLITGGNANGSNAPDDGGGGMVNNGNGAGNICSPLIRNCMFLGNSAANGGGALYNAGYTNGTSNPILINCAFQSNIAGKGGALYNDGSIGGNSNPSLINCSFQANTAGSGGAIGSVAFQGSTRPVLTNCVIWGNGGASTFNNQQGAFITTSYSLFESSVTGYNAGTGNLTTTASPFVSATDTRLSGCAPAINAGENAAYSSANGPGTDLAGNARVFPSGGRIDMGAYELQTSGGLSLTAPDVSTAAVGVVFRQSFTASGGTSPYSYSLASGSLPTGLSLATTGVLSGTPTQYGSFTITVAGRDANGCSGVSAAYVLTTQSAPPIRYVRVGGMGSGNSWADASGDLQSQINVEGARQVWVAQGTYKTTSTNDRTISFSMKDGVIIYGGFPATDTPGLADRNPGRFVTTLSGDIGTAGNTGDNSYHVISNTFIGNTAVLDGFVITGGRANGTSDQPTDGKGFGGGMYNSSSSPSLIDCIFQSNSASFEGGGLFNFGGSQPIVANCIFQSNSASFGGGMANNGGSPTVINGTFQSNTASTIGGGVYNYYGSPKLINCLFQANSAQEGGGMYSSNAETTPTVINCSFQRNLAQRGGGVANAYTNVTLTNCTFQGNNATIFGGGVYNFSCSATLTNCVLFGNGEANTLYSISGSVGATYSLFESSVTGYAGVNNLTTSVSPFVSPTDASLNGCSPAINAGDNAAYNAAYPPTISSSIDPAGNPRVFPNGGRIDMGAYEYQTAPSQTPTVAIPSVSTVTVGVAFSQTFTASGGTSPYSYTLVGGSPPSGLSLSSTGVLSGTPTQTGSFTLTVLVRSANGCSRDGAPYVLTVQPATPIRYVREGATGSGNSWADASGDLQSQIRLTGAEQVWVAQGTYKPGPAGNTDRNARFAMKNGVRILGGFPASGTPAITDRNPTSFPTVLSGDIGEAGNPADNVYNVINNPPVLTSTAVLDGFVIRDGNANGSDYRFRGGGMINNDNCSPTLINCSFVSNSASEGGGIFNNFFSNPTLINCSFIGNSASFGGAVNNYNSNPGFTNCSFLGNTASQQGSVLFSSYNIDLTLTNCVLFNNGGPNTFFTNTGSVTVRNSLLETGVTGYTDGGNNLTTTVSPFVSSSDTRINGCSPAVNAGDNATYTSANGPSTDPAGNARIFPSGGRIDMGAYEYQAAPTLITLTTPGISTATVGVAFSQPVTASGGTGPYSYSLASGSLPAGLTLASTGILSGTPTQIGSFTITVQGHDASSCSGVSAPYVLTVNEAASPVPTLTGLTASPASVCVGSVTTFTATVGNVTGNYSYTLTNGLGSLLSGTASGTAFNQSVTSSGTGPQTFTLTVDANGQSASSVTPLTVKPLPVASLTNNGPLVCGQTSVTLTAGGGSSYTFTSGRGVLGTPGPVNTVMVSQPGTYSVTVTDASGCVSTTTTVVTIDETVASVSISPSSATLSCASPTVSLSAVGTGTVRWSTGETTPSISVRVAGTYSVTLTRGSACTAVSSVTVSQDETIPTASLVSSGNLTCSVTSVTLTASPGGQTYQFSEGATPIGISNQAVVSASGTYSVTVLSGNGCTATASTSVISTTAAVTIINPTLSPATVGQAVNQPFVASGGTAPYSYSVASGNLPPGLGLASTGVLSGTPTQSGSFTITVRGQDVSSCSGVSAPYVLTVNEAASPVPTLTGLTASPASVCVGSVTTFTAMVGNVTGNYSYTLTNGTSSTSGSGTGTAFNQSLTVTDSGVQAFTLTVSSGGQSSTATTSVTVNMPPSSTLSSSGTLTCANSSVILTASGGDMYRFSSGANQLDNGPTATVSAAGVYSVTVVGSNGCSSVASTTVAGDINKPEAGLTNNGPISCLVSSVTLTASGGNSYRFSTGATQIGEGPTATVSTAGVYSVTVISTNGCTATATTTVTGDSGVPTVTIQAAPSLTIAQGQSTLLTASATGSQPLSYAWSTGQNTPAISVSMAGAYSLTVTGGNGCIATASVVVSVTATPVVRGPFSITGVSLLSCTPINEHRNVISINPEYDGLDGSPVSFSIVNEFLPTTKPGPYTLQLYVDNPIITLQAVQSGVVTSFVYNWREACSQAVTPSVNTSPTVVSAIASQTATAGGSFNLNLAGTFTDAQTPNALVLSASGLPPGLRLSGTTLSGIASMSGVSTITITATDPGGLSATTDFTLTVLPAPEGNTAPTVVGPVASQTALVGQGFTLSVASVFTDRETPSTLTLSSSGLPAGLTLVRTTISGTPSVSGTATLVLTATDPDNLSTSTSFVLTILAAPTSGDPFALVGVNTLSCTPIVAGRIDISFTPKYSGLNGSEVTFSVPNELVPTTAGGPYSLQLYTDNPTITLQAVQSGVVSQFAYNWLAACPSGGTPTPGNTAPRIAQPVGPQSATVGQGYSLNLAAVFTDTETPDKLVFSASALPAGLTLTGTIISGTPSVSGTSTVVLTATDPGSQTASTSFVLMVSPASSVTTTTPFAIASVTPVSCEVVSGGQRRVSFMPQYTGLSGLPVSFSVVNEFSATTNAGPYTLSLYVDNPVITLSARQGSVTTTYAYNWLAFCTAGARSSAPEVESGLQVRVLGNPVEGTEVSVEVRGAQNQPLRLVLTDLSGRPVSEQWIERAGGVERLRLSLGSQAGGVLLLRVSTPTQQQTLKVLKR